MSEYVIMPKTDYEAACETIRAVSGKTDLIKSGDLVTEITELANRIGKMIFQKVNPLSDNMSLTSITYGNGVFVATTNDSTKSAYSTDGINWSTTTLPAQINWVNVDYCNNVFIAVARNSTTAAYSTDGIDWITITMPDKRSWKQVAYGNGVFVAIAEYAHAAAYSTDGINWTSITMPTSPYGAWSHIVYGYDRFVVSNSDSSIVAYSIDGVSWNTATLPTSADWCSVAYGNGRYIIIDRDSTKTVYSPDGINWSIANSSIDNIGYKPIVYGNGKFLTAIRDTTTAAYSIDGINWTTAILPEASAWYSMAYGDNKLVVASSQSGSIAFIVFDESGPSGEELTVLPNFENGDVVLEPEDDIVYNKVTIVKPEGLVPENIAAGIEVAGVIGTFQGGVGRPEGEFLKYLVYQLDDDKMEIIIYGVLWQTLYRDKGNYNISIPDNFGPYQVVIASEGVK